MHTILRLPARNIMLWVLILNTHEKLLKHHVMLKTLFCSDSFHSEKLIDMI